MSRTALLPLLALFLLVLGGCPDIYSVVKDYEFEGTHFVPRPPSDPYAASPVTFPNDFQSKPRKSGDYVVEDPTVAKALMAGACGGASAATRAKIVGFEGPFGPWYFRWVEKNGRVIKQQATLCPVCLSPFCDGTNCPGPLPGTPDPRDREAWKRYWKSRGALPLDPRRPGPPVYFPRRETTRK